MNNQSHGRPNYYWSEISKAKSLYSLFKSFSCSKTLAPYQSDDYKIAGFRRLYRGCQRAGPGRASDKPSPRFWRIFRLLSMPGTKLTGLCPIAVLVGTSKAQARPGTGPRPFQASSTWNVNPSLDHELVVK